MEKRLFLAMGLSFLVLYIWSAFVVPPSHRKNQLNYPQIVENKQDIEYQDQNTVPSLPPPQDIKTSKETMNTVQTDKFILKFSNIGGTLKDINLKEYNAELPVTDFGVIEGFETVDFYLQQLDSEKVVYVYENKEIKISRTYTFKNDDYIVQSETQITNNKNLAQDYKFVLNNFSLNMSILKLDLKYNTQQDRSLYEYVINSDQEPFRKNNAYKFSEKDNQEKNVKIDWAGFRNRYFCVLVKPQYESSGYAVSKVDDEHLKIQNKIKEIKLAAGETVKFDSMIFAGPEKLDLLQKYNLGFEKIRRYYRFSLFDAMGKIVYSLMHWAHKMIPNWGVCIILISLLICFCTYPLTIQSMTSMKKLQALQPKMLALKEKHKDNPQKMNKEIMELYRENKVNPMGGCLPMLLQMPVFIGLYQALLRDVDFKGANFLWIKDLSEPDRLITFKSQLPLIGNELNLLPIIMTIVMFIQQKMTSKSMVIADSNQAAQQKMMTIIMPIFLGAIFYKLASGLTIYFTTFYILSIFTQMKMSKVTVK